MHKRRFKSSLPQIAVVCLLSILSSGAMAQKESACKALVQIGGNLWLVRADGAVIRQVTNDSQFRFAAALSPTGKLIAYSGKHSPMDVTLIDATGRLIADIDLHATDAITELKWINASLLRADEHINPHASRVHWVRLGPRNTVTVLRKVAIDSDFIEAPHRHVKPETVQTMNVAVGASVTTSTSPPFRIDVIGTEPRIVHLRITTSDGLWTEQYVPAGMAMDVQLSNVDDSTPQYEVLPSVMKKTGLVHLTVSRSKRPKPVSSPERQLLTVKIGEGNGTGEVKGWSCR